jgi:hypothetical protein
MSLYYSSLADENNNYGDDESDIKNDVDQGHETVSCTSSSTSLCCEPKDFATTAEYTNNTENRLNFVVDEFDSKMLSGDCRNTSRIQQLTSQQTEEKDHDYVIMPVLCCSNSSIGGGGGSNKTVRKK